MPHLQGVGQAKSVADQPVDLLGRVGRGRSEGVAVLQVEGRVGLARQEGDQLGRGLASGVRYPPQGVRRIDSLENKRVFECQFGIRTCRLLTSEPIFFRQKATERWEISVAFYSEMRPFSERYVRISSQLGERKLGTDYKATKAK